MNTLNKDIDIYEVLALNMPELDNFIKHNNDKSLNKLSELVCEKFNFFDSNSVPRVETCRNVLIKLQKEYELQIPEARVCNRDSYALPKLDHNVELAIDLPNNAAEIKNLELVKVDTEDDRRLWNTIIDQNDPLGNIKMIGKNLHYLVKSDNGLIGAIGYCTINQNLRCRNEFLGIKSDDGKEYCKHVIKMYRFFVVNSDCKDLKEYVMKLSLQKISTDFCERSGYEPVFIESYIDLDSEIIRYLEETGWKKIGYINSNDNNKSQKVVYTYILKDDYRKILNLPDIENNFHVLGLVEGLSIDEWVKTECSNVKFGNKCQEKNLISTVQMVYEHPGESLASAAKGDKKKLSHAYSLIDNKNNNINVQTILGNHFENTKARIRGLNNISNNENIQNSNICSENIINCKKTKSNKSGIFNTFDNEKQTVLCINDESYLNYDNLLQTEGLGTIYVDDIEDKDGNITVIRKYGLVLDTTYAYAVDIKVPLGYLFVNINAPEMKSKSEKEAMTDEEKILYKNKRPEDKQTYTLVKAFNSAAEMAPTMKDVNLVFVGDRHYDFEELWKSYDKYISSAIDPNLSILIRTNYDRSVISEDKNMMALIKEEDIIGTMEITLDEQSERTRPGDSKESTRREERTVTLSLRAKTFDIILDKKTNYSIKMNVIYALEEIPTDKVNDKAKNKNEEDRIEWYLTTCLPINTLDNVKKAVSFYSNRWKNEDLHRVCKHTNKIENIRHDNADRIRRTLAINLLVSWYIMFVCALGRLNNIYGNTIHKKDLFDKTEETIIDNIAEEHNKEPNDSIQDAVLSIAEEGGYLAGKNVRDPGNAIVGRGLQRLGELKRGANIAFKKIFELFMANKPIEEILDFLCLVLKIPKVSSILT